MFDPEDNEWLRGLAELAELATRCSVELGPAIKRAGEILSQGLLAGGKVLVCGNGGSAADAQHFVAELVGRFVRDGRPLAAVSLSSDPSVTTALANDFGFEHLFARQVEALGDCGDTLVAISTSGRSGNILRAVAVARDLGLQTIALVGQSGDSSLEACNQVIRVPNSNPQRVQELHTAILHALCEYIEETKGLR